jgi:hypothetical protein
VRLFPLTLAFASFVAFAAPPDDTSLKHGWKMHKADGEVRFVSIHHAPFPFSSTSEPEAVLSMNAVRLSPEARSLPDVVRSEIRDIRKELEVGPYLEDDGHAPEDDIASWVEDIDSQSVAFIKYRTLGPKGKGSSLPRSVRHAILIRNGKLYFVHLTVLYAAHEEEIRGDQIRLVRSLIRRRAEPVAGQ